MITVGKPIHHHIDLEAGGRSGPVCRHSTAAATDVSSSRASYDDDGQRESSSLSSSGGGTEIVTVPDKRIDRESSVSECSVDLEAGGVEEIKDDKVHFSKSERDCRICHLSLDATNSESDGGMPIELGCSCKDDLAAAHKQCAEAWFKIKGNKTCEICGSTALNVAGANEAELLDQWNEANDAAAATTAASVAQSETRNFWQGHRFLNFLLACMVFAFVISWLFHFNVPS